MSRIYSSTNRIKFTDIPEKYAVPRNFRGKQCEIHSAVVTYVYDHFRNTKKYRQKVVDALNCLTFCLLNNNPPPYDWTSADPLNTMPEDMLDSDTIERGLGDLFLTDEAIEWDVSPTANMEAVIPVLEEPQQFSKGIVKEPAPAVIEPTPVQSVTQPTVKNKPLRQFKGNQRRNAELGLQSNKPTPKEDLYIQSPKYPRFDVNKIWMSATDRGDKLVIYTTLPEIPTRQNEISVTTNLNAMTDSELMALYPNHLIHTRSPKMYERYEGIDYDEDLGCIFPIGGFTREQVVDNIICYPHLYKLKKIDDQGKISNFYSTIEIDGNLLPIAEVWDTLPESKVIPRDTEFVKEYVIRRYLLEEARGIEHRYKLFGTLDPFLTLFMPPEEYIKRGYKDTTAIVKQCVTSRVRYKQSRNPIIRRLNNNG